MEVQVQQVLVNVLTALISLGGAYIVFYVNKLVAKVKVETEKLQDEKQQKLFEDALNRVNDLIQKTVAQIEQTSAKQMREAVKDGKVDKAELEALGTLAVNNVYNQLTTDTKVVLSAELTDVEAYIQSAVEAAVLNLKNQ